jgi:hypothetical protein
MMMVLRRAGVVLIVALLALGLGGALAGAKKHKKRKGNVWGSKVTLAHPSPTRLTGSVDSKLAACSKGRLVNVFYTDPTGNSALLSVQRADGKGRYEVNLTQPAYPGVYQAQAAKERLRARRAPQTCRAADSPIFGV